MPSAASRTGRGTVSRPAIAFSMIGSRPYRNSATSVGRGPKPIAGTASASTAAGGNVCPMVASA